MFARLASLVAILLPLCTSSALTAESTLSVRDAWIREAPPAASVLAGYMVIENQGAESRELITAESAAFRAIELHRSVVEGGVARMARQDTLSIPAGGKLALQPGGYHLMLMAPQKPLRAGDEATVTLGFDNGERLAVTMRVRKVDGADHQHHH